MKIKLLIVVFLTCPVICATFPPINMVLISDPSCRYPSFLDALGDLDDCLSMCFLFGTMPQGARVHMEYINHARKLTGKM